MSAKPPKATARGLRWGGHTRPVTKTEQSVEVGGQRARLVMAGEGSPIVVLHGWGGRIESMTPVLDCLSQAFRTVAIDLPGFGESPTPTGIWGTPDYAAFVRDLLSELGITRAPFVGHSFGGKVSFYLAAVHPDLVEKLVLAAPSGLRLPPSVQARAKKVAAKAGRLAGSLGGPGLKVKEAIYDRLGSADYKQAGPMQPILVKVVNEDYQGLMPRIQASTLLVWGTEDDAVPLAAAELMEKLIPDAGLVTIEGAGHFAYLDEQARFCRVVRHFLGAPLP